MNDWCNQGEKKFACVDGRGLPCQKCGGRGYILTCDHTHPGAVPIPNNSKSIMCCPNMDKPFVKPHKTGWDDIWMDLAGAISTRSTCCTPDRNVGCVIVSGDNTKVLALGYNGSAKGDDNHCDYNVAEAKVGKSRCTCIHAEMNALIKLDTSNPLYKKMYLTLSPCDLCWKLIVNAGIDEVIYLNEYSSRPIESLRKLDVEVRQYEDHRGR